MIPLADMVGAQMPDPNETANALIRLGGAWGWKLVAVIAAWLVAWTIRGVARVRVGKGD